MGWQEDGYLLGTPARLPVNAQLGGAQGLQQLRAELQRGGGKLMLQDHLGVAFGASEGFNPRKEAVRDIDSRVMERSYRLSGTFSLKNNLRKYYIAPSLYQHYFEQDRAGIAELGIDGLLLEGVGQWIYSDFTPNRLTRRHETAGFYRELLASARQEGRASVFHGNAYTLGEVGHISRLPLDTSYDMLASIPVPFYPIALHGLVSYSGDWGNLRQAGETQFLREIEYGAVPSYLLTYASPGLLKDTLSNWIYSSQYDAWKEQIVQEYQRQADAIGDLRTYFIEDHRKLAADVYETVYENGDRVIVNYRAEPYELEGVRVDARNFAVLRGGE